MATISNQENAEELKKANVEKDALLQEMKTKNIATAIVDERMSKFLSSVKWVVGILSVILTFLGWSTFTGMRDQIKVSLSDQLKTSVSDQIKHEISNQSILEGLERDFNELQENLVLENLKLKVNLFNDGRQGLLGDRNNNIIPKRYEAVLLKMIGGHETKAEEVINILNDISPEKIYLQRDFFGEGFDTLKTYTETLIRNTKDQKLKLACTKFLINFCFDDNEKIKLVMEYLQKTKDDKEITYLLPRIAYHLRSNNRRTNQPIPMDFVQYCNDKIKKSKDSLLLMSSYLSLLNVLNESQRDFQRVKEDFEQKCEKSMARFPDIMDAMDFLMEFNFIFLSNDNSKENKNIITRFIANTYKINREATSSYLKAKLFLMSNINQEFYINLFGNLVKDKSLTKEDRIRLIYQFSVQDQQEVSNNLEYIPVGYLKNSSINKIKVKVNIDDLNVYDDSGNIVTIKSDSLFIEIEKKGLHNLQN